MTQQQGIVLRLAQRHGLLGGHAARRLQCRRDDLQQAMALIRKDMTELPLSFDNFRD